MDDYNELRDMVLDRFDVFDLVELLDLTTEDLIDQFDILGDPSFRTCILRKLFED